INWRPKVGVNRYSVRWRKDNGNWNTYITQSPDHEIPNITPGTFDVEVFSLDSLNRSSTAALTGGINALGKTAPPSDVSGLTRTIDEIIGVMLDWSPVADLDLRDYEIRRGGTDWDSATFQLQGRHPGGWCCRLPRQGARHQQRLQRQRRIGDCDGGGGCSADRDPLH
ncbi:MAG: hypothetical protein EBT27_03115, partial [Betaproteobacteria bacterium]|nr:hypothetical protein [Betaproteobacteria bacterium]